jgi:hypothetical protein
MTEWARPACRRADSLTRALLAAAALGALAVAAVPMASAATGPGRAQDRASWHTGFTLSGPERPLFTAVTAASGRRGWAFSSAGGKAPGAFTFTGSSWVRRSFHAGRDDIVTWASSSSPSNVWAFTSRAGHCASTAAAGRRRTNSTARYGPGWPSAGRTSGCSGPQGRAPGTSTDIAG